MAFKRRFLLGFCLDRLVWYLGQFFVKREAPRLYISPWVGQTPTVQTEIDRSKETIPVTLFPGPARAIIVMSEDPTLPRADQSTDMEEYAPISGMAIAAFILSLFTPVALYAIGLAVLALLPVILGVLASVNIGRASHPIKGRGLATMSIAISMFFVTASAFGHTMIRQHLSKQAQIHFEEWIEVVARGDLHEAHELHRQYSKRQLPGTNLEAIYSKEIDDSSTMEERTEMESVMLSVDFSPKQEFTNFFDGVPVKDIVEHAADAEFKFLRVQEAKFGRPDSEIAMLYRMTFPQGGVKRQVDFIVIMMRSRYEGGEFHWHVFDVAFPPKEQ